MWYMQRRHCVYLRCKVERVSELASQYHARSQTFRHARVRARTHVRTLGTRSALVPRRSNETNHPRPCVRTYTCDASLVPRPPQAASDKSLGRPGYEASVMHCGPPTCFQRCRFSIRRRVCLGLLVAAAICLFIGEGYIRRGV